MQVIYTACVCIYNNIIVHKHRGATVYSTLDRGKNRGQHFLTDTFSRLDVLGEIGENSPCKKFPPAKIAIIMVCRVSS